LTGGKSKTCYTCGVEKPLSEYHKAKRNRSGYRGNCKVCESIYQKNRRKEKFEQIAAHDKKRKQEFKEKDHEGYMMGAYKSKLKTAFGLTLEQYDQMLEDQNGVCAICGKPETKIGRSGLPQRLSVDHNHQTGQVRQLLCHACNMVVGFSGEDIRTLYATANYLLRHSLKKEE